MDKNHLRKFIAPQLSRARALGIPVKSLTISPRKNKKYRIELTDGTIVDYGHPDYDDYLVHRDSARRERFLKRWANHPRVNDPTSPVYYIVRLNW
jgi:hypothetical protein